MKYLPLFVLIQLVNIPLMVMGWFICLSPALAKASWLWWNDEDGWGPGTTWWSHYIWLAWRNSVANYKHVPGVSGTGRPLWLWTNGKYYAKAGWFPDNGHPVLSAGSGTH
jgi:uncharacterized membrane-anchored protein YitT (DUF2179 family)